MEINPAPPPSRIVIGTRGSPLAVWQAHWVKDQLEGIHTDLKVEIVIIKTSGDKILDVPLNKIGGKGLFVKEIEEAMMRREIDIAVHSMKDVPMKLPFELCLSAICEREVPFDALVSRNGLKLDDLPENAKIGTSSLRRSTQLLNCRPDLQIVPLRGNVNTRLAKLDTQELDAIVLAAAGMRRMGWESRITEILQPELLLPAMGQGAVGIEARKSDPNILGYVGELDHEETHFAVEAERAFVNALDGGCQVPIGAYAVLENDTLRLTGLVSSLDGRKIFKLSKSGAPQSAREIGETMGREILSMGADAVLKEILQ
ncbi:MAG: hydroxymethylbilane synthase [Nitrospinae bacterium CG11_big_fil_rev_8_21_14_0_20_56_8]|nr:MAG: hydroxymethylbilane synthase [Nitrospinae bacterium CG11_big_fil_rev_8_21_14_0_20_56_8]